MARPDQPRPDELHIYVRHDGKSFYLAEDGSFVPDLKKGRVFASWDDAFAKLDELVGDRDLGKDEPGIVRNAWKWA